MSTPNLEERLAQKAKLGDYVRIQDLPSSVNMKVENWEEKKDTKNNECIYLRFVTEDGKKLSQKYTPTCYADLVDLIKKAGGYEVISKTFLTWEKRRYGRSQNDRFYPRIA